MQPALKLGTHYPYPRAVLLTSVSNTAVNTDIVYRALDGNVDCFSRVEMAGVGMGTAQYQKWIDRST